MNKEKQESILNGSSILITGGTGSFGNHVIEKLLQEFSPARIIIFSRDEKKQFDMRNRVATSPAPGNAPTSAPTSSSAITRTPSSASSRMIRTSMPPLGIASNGKINP